MPPKPTGKEKVVEEEEEILQAVILADSYNSRFGPLTADLPRCLLPVCNSPLLDWTFEALASAGVQQVFVFCSSHVGLIKDAIAVSRWSQPSSGLKIIPIFSGDARSVGDAMRELDAKQILSGDFVLVTGDIVSNIRIDEVVKEHKERRKVDKNVIMTMVMRPAGPRDRPRPGSDSTIYVMCGRSFQCLHYDYVPSGKNSFQIPAEVYTFHTDLDVRVDLVDCSIDICTPDVLALFTENFDYQELRSDFVRGVLTSDLLDKTIYCHVAKSGYASRVKDTRSYGTISQDIISRRTFPLVPDDNHLRGDGYELRRGFVYISKDDVHLSRTCIIGNHTIIAAGSEVQNDARISSSVIGKACRIGTGAVINDSYVWDGAQIGSNCVIEESIIAADVKILDGTRIARGCLVGKGVVLGPDANLEAFARVTRVRPKEDEDWGEGEEVQTESDRVESALYPSLIPILGSQAKAYLWPDPDEDDDKASVEGDDLETPQNLKLSRLGDRGLDTELVESEASDMDSVGSSPLGSPRSTGSGVTELTEAIPALSLDSSADFASECMQSLERAYDEGHTIDNAAIELKTLRMASNVPLKRVAECVVNFLASKIDLVTTPAAQREKVNSTIERWGPLLTSIGWDDPTETVSMLQRYCALHPQHQKTFGPILAAMYNEDIVEYEDVKKWYARMLAVKKQGLDPTDILAATLEDSMQQAVKLIQHIHSLEQEDDDDDDEDDEEEDSE